VRRLLLMIPLLLLTTLLISVSDGTESSADAIGTFAGYFGKSVPDGVAGNGWSGPLLYPIESLTASVIVPILKCNPTGTSSAYAFIGSLSEFVTAGVEMQCNAGKPAWLPVYTRETHTTHHFTNAGAISPGDALDITISWPGVVPKGGYAEVRFEDNCTNTACKWSSILNLAIDKTAVNVVCGLKGNLDSAGTEYPLTHFAPFTLSNCAYVSYPPEGVGQSDPDTDCNSPKSTGVCTMPVVSAADKSDSVNVERVELVGATGNQLVSISSPKIHGLMEFTWLEPS